MYSNKLYINRSIFSLALTLAPLLAPNTDQFFFHRYVVFLCIVFDTGLSGVPTTQPNSERMILFLIH